MYAEGQGVAQNDKQAMAWFQKAANQNNPLAQFNLGNVYREGRGVAQNYQQALAWYQKAANQGLASAQNSLAMMYCEGKGTTKNYQQAKLWWQKVLAQPDTEENAEAKAIARNGLQALKKQGIR